MVENWERTSYERLWALFREAERTALRGRAEVRVGPPVDEILSVADEQNADLIILGTHGRGPLGHLFLGSVADGSCAALGVRSLPWARPRRPLRASYTSRPQWRQADTRTASCSQETRHVRTHRARRPHSRPHDSPSSWVSR